MTRQPTPVSSRERPDGPQPVRLATIVAAAALGMCVIAACARDTADQYRHFLESGDRFALEGQFREAIIEYRNAVQIDGMSGEARLKLAEAYEKTGDGSNALQEYIRAADLLPDDVAVQLKSGEFLLAARRVDDALMRADAVIKLSPENVDAHILRGNALGGLNDFEQALKAMEEALRLDPARGATYTQIGLVESARGRTEEAEAAFKRAIELVPSAMHARLALANFYWASGRHTDAAGVLTAALEQDPGNQSANQAMAVFSLATGRIGEAEQYLRQLVGITKTEQSQLTLAEYYTATNRPAEAIKILAPLVATTSASVDARVRLSRAYASAGERAKATAMADAILNEYPRDVSAQLLKAQLLMAENRRDDALASVKSAVAADPSSAAAQFTLGRVYAARGDLAGAESAFREVLKINPTAAAAQVELSALHLASGAASAAVKAAEAAVQSRPDRLDARLTLIRALLASRQFDRAERELKSVLVAYPNSAPVLVQSAVLAASRNDRATARATFERALQLDPSSLEALGGLLAIDMAARDFEAAQSRLAAHLEKTPNNAALLLLAARTYAPAGNLERAEQSLRHAIQIDSTLLQAYAMLGQIYVQQGKLTDALREFDALAGRQSNPVGALTMAGMILEALNNRPQASLRYERAVSVDPRAAVAANNLAWLYAESGQHLDDALRMARTAAEVLPDSVEVLDTLGAVYLKSGLASTAIPPLVRCVERQPESGDCWYHLGLAYQQTGESEQSQRAFQKAQSLSDNKVWAEEVQRLLTAK